MVTQTGPLRAEVREVAEAVGTVVLAAGLGLGPWFWRPWFETFAQRKLRSVAVELPGADEDPSVEEAVAALRGVVAATEGPVTLVGHSAMGIVAQLAAYDLPLHALVLVCSLPPGQIRSVPERDVLLRGARLLPALLRGAPVRVPYGTYRAVGLTEMDEAAAKQAYEQIRPWPNRLSRALLRPPSVDPSRIEAPVLQVLGKQDRLIPWDRARIVGDLHECVTWRYDDLGHMPPLEPNGLRMARDVARFVLEPIRPKVIESEGYMPSEGVGHQLRRSRRGEMMKLRSAYGQKKSARG